MKKILILGGGGHAKVLIDALLLQGKKIEGILDHDKKLHGKFVLGVKVLGGDDLLDKLYPPSVVILVNGVGSTQDTKARKKLFFNMKKRGYAFLTVIHPSSVVAKSAQVLEGAQILAQAQVGPGARLGFNCIVNNAVNVDHDCVLGDHAHLAPGVVLSGQVEIGEGAHVGTAAVVIQGLKIGPASLVAAGAVVIDDVKAKKRYAGVPAKEIKKR